jgi:hypothetical protein
MYSVDYDRLDLTPLTLTSLVHMRKLAEKYYYNNYYLSTIDKDKLKSMYISTSVLDRELKASLATT